MIHFFPFIFERRGGSRRIGHVRPTPKPKEAEPTRQETSRSILMNSLHAAQKLLAGE